MVSWRKNNEKNNDKYDLVFVCGYAFNTYGCKFMHFKNLNINNPLKTIKKHTNKKSLVVFINTYDQNQKYTYSRYKYAKIKLAYLISKNIKKFILINVPLIVDDNSNIMIKSSFFSSFCINSLIKLRLIKTIKIKNVYELIDNYIKQPIIKNKILNIDGRNLCIPRTQFIDRTLRFILN